MEASLDTWEKSFLDRLPVDRLEIRNVDNRFYVSVGLLARCVNMDPAIARTVQMNEDAVMAAARATATTYVVTPKCMLPQAMARQPLLACKGSDHIFLLDGLQRAALAFAQGVPKVQVRLVPMELAILLRSRHSLGERSRLFEATRNHPVGAEPGDTHTTAIVQLAAYTDLKREGQRLSELAAFLKDLLLFRTICAVERELAIVETLPQAARKKLEDAGSKRGREQQLILRWKKQYKLPVAPTWRVCANEAKRVIATCSAHDGKRTIDRAIRSEMANSKLASAMRDQEIRHRNILLKAFTRVKELGSYASSLVANDHDLSVSDETAIQRARRKVMMLPFNGNRRVKAAASRKEVEDALSKPEPDACLSYVIDFHEQVILAKGYGINPTVFCHECVQGDALFEAYAFAYRFKVDGRAPSSPAMVETYLQRRALAEVAARAGQVPRDLTSRLWADLFEYYAGVTHEKGSIADGVNVKITITEIIKPETLSEMDEREVIDSLDNEKFSYNVCSILL